MISINFASRNYRLMERLRRGLAVVNVLLIGVMVLILWTALSLRAGISSLEEKVRDMEAAEEQVKPLLAERDRVIKDLNAMSGLLESRRFSWTKLLTSIEKSFPLGVAVGKVEYNPRDRALTFDGAARSPESLRNLIVGLEQSPRFKDPYLKHQSIDKGSIFFNVVAFYQEQKDTGVDQGK